MRRRSLITGMLAGISSSLTARRAHAAAPLRYIPAAPLDALDPVVSAAPPTRDHGFMVWDTLYGLDAGGLPQPQMCEGHEANGDGLAWRFTLRQGLRFHDDTPVTGRDCVASLLRWMQSDGNGSLLFTRLADITVDGDRDFRLRLTHPVPRLLQALASPVGRVAFIMPEHVARTDADTPIGEPIGSGPYRFDPDAWRPGRSAGWTRFDGYQPRSEPASGTAGGKHALFERVEWHTISDPAEATSLVEAGEADWWADPITDLLPVIEASRHIVLRDLNPAGVVAALRLTLDPPFDDPTLRRRLLAAIEQSSLIKAATAGRQATTDIGIFPPDSALALAAGLPPHPDHDRSSWPAVAPVQLALAPGEPTREALCLAVAQAMASEGLVVKSAAEAPTASCMIIAAAACEDPGSHPALQQAAPPLDRVRDTWFDAANPTTVANEIQRAVLAQATFLPLGAWRQPIASRRELTGFVSAGLPIFWGVRREP